jgi:protein-tyrosine phosphatase
MIDIHCHILPSIDDGPSDTDTSLGMSRIAANDGTTHIVATPHYRYGEKPTTEEIQEAIRVLGKRIDQEGVPVRLLGGADIRLTYELLEGIETCSVPTINDTRYFLIEIPDLIPPNLDDFIFEATLRGYVPVITHPERNYTLLSAPERIDELRGTGALFQVTAMSITGEFGLQIKRYSQMLLRKGVVDFVASDAHSTNRRPPGLSKAYRVVSEILDRRQADRIFLENPAAMIEDRELK